MTKNKIYEFIPIVAFLILFLVATQKYLFFSTSDFYQTPRKTDIILYLLIETIQLISIALIHEIIYKLSIMCKCPTIISDIIFTIIYIILIVFSILDCENSREMQNDITIDYFMTYGGIPNLYAKNIQLRNYVESGEDYGRGITNTVSGAMSTSKAHYYFLIFGIILIVLVAVIILIIYRKELYKEVNKYHYHHKITWTDIIITDDIEQPSKNNKYFKYGCLTFKSICLIVDIVLIVVFCLQQPTDNILSGASPAIYKTFRSFNTLDYDEDFIYNQTQIYQQQISYNDRYIISDQYPLVHGNLNQWCSWNKEQCLKKYNLTESDIKPAIIENQSEQPNVIMIFYESWSPSPSNIDKQIYNYQTDDGWYPQQPYDEEIFPQLVEITKNTINFLSLATASLPTVQAWPTLITSEKPNLVSFNMIKGVEHETEALPNILKKYNYHTTYVSPAPGDFDGKNYWYSQKDLFDEVHYYAPNDEQLKMLNIKDNPQSSWIEDNILIRQAMIALAIDLIDSGRTTLQKASETYCKYIELENVQYCEQVLIEKQRILHENKDFEYPKTGQPIMLSLLNVNTHSPWQGNYDKELNYYNMSLKSDYQRMLQFSQKYISDLINFALELDSNTIFTINGDHGARTNDLDLELEVLQEKCKYKTSGNDQMFTVSGIIGKGDGVQNSLLNDEELSKYYGQTYLKMFDFDDLQNLLLLSLNINIPTSRVSFFDYNDVITGKWLEKTSNKISASATHTILEVRNNDNIYRGSLFKSSNGIFLENAQYPTCIKKGDQTDLETEYTEEELLKMEELYSKGANQLQLMNWYQDNNQFYSRKFIREECQVDIINKSGQFCQL